MLKKCMVLFLLLPVFALATQFQAGKDYKVITLPQVKLPAMHLLTSAKKNQTHTVVVTEFFSFGCPACFHFEPTLETWLKNKPDNVIFQRIPVVFNSRWLTLAKAYYIAKQLGITKRMVPAIFAAVQSKRINLTNTAQLAQLFAKHGVSQARFRAASASNATTAAKMLQIQTLLHVLNIYQIPTLVVDGKYKVNPAMTAGNANKTIAVLNYLINKANQKRITHNA